MHLSDNQPSVQIVLLCLLAADTQLIKGFVRPSVCWSPAWVDKWGNKCFLIFFAHVWVCSGVGVWMGAGRPCPPVRPVCCSVSLLFNPLGRNDWVKKCKDEHFCPAWVYGSGRGCERRLYACQPIHSDIVTLQYLFKQVTWGHNTAQTHTQIITIAASKMRVFVLINSIIMDQMGDGTDGLINRPTEGLTEDKASYRVTCPQLKTSLNKNECMNEWTR